MKTCPQCESGFPDSHTTCPTHGVLLNEIRQLKPGMLIRNTYRIVRLIGKGGMGSVYLAQHTLMDEQQALKFLSSELSQDQSFASRFLREVRTLRQVRHKNVVDAGNLEPAEDGTLFFSMEFVDGPDLLGLMQTTTGPFPVARALEITRGIAEGLGAAHAKGMVHRDIKPENILMAREGDCWVPKIADFGIVATKENSRAFTKTGGTLLTMAYAAPEQWLGTPAAQLDGRTDLYALGGVLFEMLTGQTVFDADSYEGWATKHKNAAPRPPSAVRPDLAYWQGLDALVLRMLAKNRADRPQDVAEVLQLLGAIHSMPQPRRVTEQETAPAPVRRIDKSAIITEPRPLETSPGDAALQAKSSRNLPTMIVWGIVAALLITVTVAALIKKWSVPTHPAETSANRAAQTSVPAAVQPEQVGDRKPSNQPAAETMNPKPLPAENPTPAAPKPEMPPQPLQTPLEDTKLPLPTSETTALRMQASKLFNQDKYADAEPLFEQACDGNDGRACLGLGWMYEHELGVKLDMPRAVALYLKACAAGVADGCSSAGYLYYAGWGVAEDDTRAVRLTTRACNGGSGSGCASLGLFYRDGKGVAQDTTQARAFFNKACTLGNEAGCERLKQLP
jgi:serine/threonine-protein kinase